MNGYEKIKVWAKNGFRLTLYDTCRRDETGKNVLAYRFCDKGKLIFQGEDFGCSPMHAIDSMDTVYSLLSFLSLKPGDTDKEYFDSYTPAQLAWRDDRAEALSYLVLEGEERLAKLRHIIHIQVNADPYGGGWVGSESKDGGTSWFYRGDVGAMSRQWWRNYCRKNGCVLRQE